MVNEQIIDISGPLKGEIEVPGDKSMTHRAIMLASLAEGVSTIYKPLIGEDCSRHDGHFPTVRCRNQRR